MKNTLEFLDEVKAKLGLTSDYQLAKSLGCTHSAISNYRAGKSRLDEAAACKVAELLNLDAGYVLACIASERAKKPEVKAAWQHTAQILGGLAAALAVIAFLPFITLPVDPLQPAIAFDNSAFYTSGIYIMRTLAVLLLLVIVLISRGNRDETTCARHFITLEVCQ